MGNVVMVGMAEIKVTCSSDDVLVALGLGACVVVCAFDPVSRVAGMAHVVLPDSAGYEASPAKFADTAIPLLLEQMLRSGAAASQIRIALAGGAQLFAFSGNGPRLEIGPRNATAVRGALEKAQLSVVAADIGGSSGRTVHLTGDGLVRVKTIGTGERELVMLGLSQAVVPSAVGI